MTKEDIYKTVYDLMSEIYECEGGNSPDRTLGEIMGIMSMALEIENMAISEPKTPEHDGCKNCRHINKDRLAAPCRECKQAYTDKWEGVF